MQLGCTFWPQRALCRAWFAAAVAVAAAGPPALGTHPSLHPLNHNYNPASEYTHSDPSSAPETALLPSGL